MLFYGCLCETATAPKVSIQLPESLARRFRVMLLESNEHNVLLAMADPTDLLALDELTRILSGITDLTHHRFIISFGLAYPELRLGIIEAPISSNIAA